MNAFQNATFRAAPTSAIRVDAPKSDLVRSSNVSGGVAVDFPGFHSSGTIGLQTSLTSWKDNGVFVSACLGTNAFFANLNPSNWRSILTGVSLQPAVSFGADYAKPQESFLTQAKAPNFETPLFAGAVDSQTGEWSFSFSPTNFNLGVRDASCSKLLLSPRTAVWVVKKAENSFQETLDEANRAFEKFYREFQDFMFSKSINFED